ncbi:sensor histidine kinase [Actinomadura luteofluorescens]
MRYFAETGGSPGGPATAPGAKPGTAVDRVPAGRVTETFRLIMHLRTALAGVSMLLLPRDRLTFGAIALVTCVGVVSWLAARHAGRVVALLERHPLLAALDAGVPFGVLALGGPLGPFFLSTLLTALVAGLLFDRVGVAALSVLHVLCYVGTIAFVPEAQQHTLASFQALVGQPACYPLAAFAGRTVRRMLEENADADRARVRAEAVAAAAQERLRLARDMHDSVGKTLGGIALAATALPLWLRRDPERAAREAHTIAEHVRVAAVEARELISGLRDPALDRPLAETVAARSGAWRDRHEVRLRCRIDPAADLSPSGRRELLAIHGEALANVARHAGARSVTVRLAVEPDAVVLCVSDDGRGFALTSVEDLAREGHYGLLGLRERAESIGGTLSVESRPGTGTTVTVRVRYAGTLRRAG